MNGEQKSTPDGWQFKPEATNDTSNQQPLPSSSPSEPGVAQAQAAPHEAKQNVASPQPVQPAASPAAPAEAPAVPTAPAQATDDASLEQFTPIEWSASEAPHPRPAGWTAMLIGGALVVAGLVYLLTRDFVNVGAVIVAAALLAVYNNRKPQTVHYQLERRGFIIGNRHYGYDEFRSYAIEDVGAGSRNIVLMPLKRFMPLVVVNYKLEMEHEVAKVFADRLPLEVYRRDALDSLSRKLRF